MNIQIPQIVGSVVNVIAKFNDSKDSGMFLGEMKMPAVKLVLFYLAQVFFMSEEHKPNHYNVFFVFAVNLHIFLYLYVIKYWRKNGLSNES